MLGVVLWSDALDRKAVIWCEDQGDLAFLNATDDLDALDVFFDAGDVVQFDMEVHASTRLARNPRLVIENAGANLPDALRARQPQAATMPARASAQVIPFKGAARAQEACAPRRRTPGI